MEEIDIARKQEKEINREAEKKIGKTITSEPPPKPINLTDPCGPHSPIPFRIPSPPSIPFRR